LPIGAFENDNIIYILFCDHIIVHKTRTHIPHTHTQVKASLTREYNSVEHRSQALVSSQGLQKKKRAASAAVEEEEDGIEVEENISEVTL
jgi:hypothetical protein